MGKHSSPQFPYISRLLLKEKSMMLHSNKPCQNFFETCCCHQVQVQLKMFLKWGSSNSVINQLIIRKSNAEKGNKMKNVAHLLQFMMCFYGICFPL